MPEAVELTWPAEGVALATMTRAAEMNTLTLELIGEMGQVLDVCTAEKARALVITGSGRAFCCGAHLDYFTDPNSSIVSTTASRSTLSSLFAVPVPD